MLYRNLARYSREKGGKSSERDGIGLRARLWSVDHIQILLADGGLIVLLELFIGGVRRVTQG